MKAAASSRPSSGWLSSEAARHWQLRGVLFDGNTSQAYPAHAWLEGDTLHLATLEAPERRWCLPLAQVEVQPALAQLPRVLALRGTQALGLTPVPLGSGARLECEPACAPAVQWLERGLRRNALPRLVAALEGRWGGVALSVLLLAGFGYAFINAGLPLVACQAAQRTPVEVLQKLDNETVRYITKQGVLKPSRLSAQRQQQLRRGFAALVRERGGAYHYRLLFRQGGPMKANAFALPAGSVVITDELIGLSHSDQEIYGVLAHELSHVTHRDALTQIYQALGLSLLVGAITGDLVGPGTTAAAVPTFLLQSRYSRQMESVADHAAGEYLLAHLGTTRPLQAMLGRLDSQDEAKNETKPAGKAGKKPSQHPQNRPSKNKGKQDSEKNQPAQSPYAWIGHWLEDHPATEQRIEDLQRQEAAWKQQGGK